MEYLLKGKEDYRLIPQKGVKQYVYPERFTHNAIWDSNAGPDGKLYYGLATEIAANGYVRLCCYDPEKNDVTELFRAEDVIMPQDRAIRASKFHSSIFFMPDGRMIMTTHTTDRSPRHPTWLPWGYYHHLWEGFAGGHIILYDPATGKAENLGIPVPHESIYGACYEPDTNRLFFTGWLRGHLYCYDLNARRVTDMGKTSENCAFRLVRADNGFIYGASRSGYLYRIDPKSLEIRDLNYQFPHETYKHSCRYNDLTMARTGPDGRLYMACMYCRSFFALDPKTDEIEELGHYLPTLHYSADENRNGVFGFDFDSKGVLWYVVTSLNNYEENREFGIPAGLFRWDVTRGGQPEFMGIAGTAKRACGWNSEVVCTKDDLLYIVGSNHSLDGPDLMAIDLKLFESDKPCTGGYSLDRYFDPEAEEYVESANSIHHQEKMMGENSAEAQLPLASDPVLLWRALAPDHIPDSAVKRLFWKGDRLCGICGEMEKYAFEIMNGKLCGLWKLSELPEEKKALYEEEEPAFDATDLKLPYVPGRQYKAVCTASAKLAGGRTLIGTLDGLLAITDGVNCYALGAPAANGPIHALSAAPGGTVYGVAGDEDDIATLFCYDEANGMRALGYMQKGVVPKIEQIFGLTYVTSCAVSPDGKTLAVGANERIGTVVLYAI